MRLLVFALLGLLPALAQTPESLKDTGGTAEQLLRSIPGISVEPYDFGQIARDKLPVFSIQGASWTRSRYTVEGIGATDPYQPGRPVILPDPFSVSEIRVGGSALNYSFTPPASTWHGSGTTWFTGKSLFSDNLPSLGQRGPLYHSDRFERFTHANVKLGGNVTRWLDVLFSGSGRWSKQTAPLDPSDRGITSSYLYSTARVAVRPTKKDHIDILILGGRANDSGWSLPHAVEALAARRMAPVVRPSRDLRQEDHLDFIQLGWTRPLWGGEFRSRYGYSATHQDTLARSDSIEPIWEDLIIARQEAAYVDIQNGVLLPRGGPLLQTLAVMPQHGGDFAWTRSGKHTVAITASFGHSIAANRFLNPPHSNAFLLNGVRVSGIIFDTPQDTRARIRRAEFGASDAVRLSSNLTLDLGVTLANWNGLARSAPAGIKWTSVAPRAALAVSARALVIRAGYARSYAPLAGRYLDYGNPNALSGQEYLWNLANDDRNGLFYDGRPSDLLRRFGGRYSQLDPSLRQPFTDEVFLSAEIARGPWFARARAFRAIDRRRIAAVNTGVPFSSYAPRQVLDPGADFLAGTPDDRTLTVFEQNPATFGQDFFQLTNPGIRMRTRGVLLEGGVKSTRLSAQSSLFLGKSWGPTNPGNQYWENDSGVVGALYADPNTLLFADGRPALDRGFLSKTSIVYRAPRGVELMTSAWFTGGYPYSRRLLVEGLSQGPLIVAATPRGSEGGYRTPRVFQWDMRVSKPFELGRGTLRVSADVFNLLNRATNLREDDLSNPRFQDHLPWSIQPPRFARIGLSWEF